MHPCELNAAIAALTNHLYCSLTKEQFVNLGILLSLVSKDILSMAAVEGLCKREERKHRPEAPKKEKGPETEHQKKPAADGKSAAQP